MHLILLVLIGCLIACGDDADSKSQPHDAGEPPDATVAEVPPVEDRDEPACEALGRVASVNHSFHATTNFFAGCDGTSTEPVPDVAFTWTAPEAGLYRVGLGSSEPWETSVALGIRRGECALTESEGAAAPPEGELSCESMALTTEDGENDPYQILAVDEGETLTILAEGDDYFLYSELDEIRRQTLGLTIGRVRCPGVRVRDDSAQVTIVEELPSRFPVYFQISSSTYDPKILPLSCSAPTNDRQYPIAWTAPEAGRYTFEAELEYGVSVAIAAFQGSCIGEELACAQGDRATSISLELAAGEKVILFVEIDGFSDDDHDIALSVRSETATPEHAECEPLGDGSTAVAASFHTDGDVFDNCREASDLPDKAFTWTAPSRGLYAFSLASEALSVDTASELTLRRGACALTADDPPICAGRRVEAADYVTRFAEVIEVDAGETITIIANGDYEYQKPHSGVSDFQWLTAMVEPARCPLADQKVSRDMTEPVDRVPSIVPYEATLVSRTEDLELRTLSCSTARYARQLGVSWTAPSAGRYRFAAATDTAADDALAIAALRGGDCLGAELGCDAGPGSSALTLQLEADEEIVLILELGDPSYADADLELSITEAP